MLLLKLLRINQWIKNIFVLLPLCFVGKLLSVAALVNLLGIFILFCIASSSVYIVNDIWDRDADKKHPIKAKKRPIAAGEISIFQAICVLLLLYLILLIAFLMHFPAMNIIFFYLIINFAYTFRLKQIPIIDLFCVASGFVLRFYSGALILQINLSVWIYLTIFHFALCILSGKRKIELLTHGVHSRVSLQHYNIQTLEHFNQLSATATIICYCLFITTKDSVAAVTVPLLIYWLLRFTFITEKNGNDCPTQAFSSDPQLIIVFILTIMSWFYLFY